ncbi:MAG: SOS response-associated peptidase [Methanomicrobiales archaeon]|nr:SOS response-associated peptidase [Methanomicrobiales archaeon]
MCGRFAIAITVGFHDRFGVQDTGIPVFPRYNIAPTQEVPVIVSESPRRIVSMRWGLIPRWAKDPKIGSRMINARAETLEERPAFRDALASRRCLVPATGFFEWKKEGTRRIPYYIRLKGHPLFAFAGLYDRWWDPAGAEIASFTIITTCPNVAVAPLHDRMPAVLLREYEEPWVGKGVLPEAVREMMFDPIDAHLMEAYPVSSMVSNPNIESEDIIRPV